MRHKAGCDPLSSAKLHLLLLLTVRYNYRCKSAPHSRGQNNCQPGNGSRQANHLNGTSHPVLRCSSFCHICLVSLWVAYYICRYERHWYFLTSVKLSLCYGGKTATYHQDLYILGKCGIKYRKEGKMLQFGIRWWKKQGTVISEQLCMYALCFPASELAFFFKQIFICVFSAWPMMASN